MEQGFLHRMTLLGPLADVAVIHSKPAPRHRKSGVERHSLFQKLVSPAGRSCRGADADGLRVLPESFQRWSRYLLQRLTSTDIFQRLADSPPKLVGDFPNSLDEFGGILGHLTERG